MQYITKILPLFQKRVLNASKVDNQHKIIYDQTRDQTEGVTWGGGGTDRFPKIQSGSLIENKPKVQDFC